MRNRRRPIMNRPNPRKLVILLCFILFAFTIISSFEYLNHSPVPTVEHPIELLGNQTRDDLKQAHFKAIESAEKSILLIIYALNDKKLIRTLNNKSEEGVDIQVICDKNASSRIHRKLNPAIAISKPNKKGLMHLKILVIDNQLVWLGSANLTNDSLRIHGNLVAGFQNRALANYITAKAATMIDPAAPAVQGHKTFIIGNQVIELWFLPHNTEALRRLKDLIRQANKTIRVAMYTWTRRDMAKIIVDAHKRGVDVQVVIDGSSSRGASQHVVKILHDGGVPVRISTGNGLLHHKFIYLDGNTLVNGSANWTKAAFTQNDDCYMIFNDLNSQQQEKLNHLWKVIYHESIPAKSRSDRLW